MRSARSTPASSKRDATPTLNGNAGPASPPPSRWPHRNPGYDLAAMQQRQAKHTPARVAAQDFPTSVPDLTRARDWPEPSHDQPSRHPRQAERDGPEAAL